MLFCSRKSLKLLNRVSIKSYSVNVVGDNGYRTKQQFEQNRFRDYSSGSSPEHANEYVSSLHSGKSEMGEKGKTGKLNN